MDGISLPEIIGLLFFLMISLLTSYFEKRKKDKQKAERERSAPPPDLDSQHTQNEPVKEKAEKSVFDIFQEAFEEKEEEYFPPQVPDYNQRFEVGTPLSDEVKPEFIDTEKLIQIELKNKLFKAAQNKKEVNKRALEIRSKLRKKKSIREIIVLKEILDKPKALRK